MAAYRYVSWRPTTTAGDTLGALIADPRSDILLRAPSGAGIRGTQVRTLAYEEVAHVDIALMPVGGWGPNLGQGHLDAQQAAEAVRRTHPDRAVPVHWGTWWPIGLPQRADLIDLPAMAFADHVAHLAPTTSVHLLKHGQSVRL